MKKRICEIKMLNWTVVIVQHPVPWDPFSTPAEKAV